MISETNGALVVAGSMGPASCRLDFAQTVLGGGQSRTQVERVSELRLGLVEASQFVEARPVVDVACDIVRVIDDLFFKFPAGFREPALLNVA
jgi:hypothetical protein